MSSADPLRQRVFELEAFVTHLQVDVETMNEVILEQQAVVESLREQIERLRARVESAEEGPEIRDLREERPPHY